MPEVHLPTWDCTACLACVDACGKEALRVVFAPGTGFARIIPDQARCVGCGNCERHCPVLTKTGYGNNALPSQSSPYTAWTTNCDDRENSSSGGVFPALAKTVLQTGGAVAGAVMDGRRVRHKVIRKTEELPALQGSKYLWSDCSGIYREVRQLLRQGTVVLFSGTPCQCAGLLTHVTPEQREKLFLVDLVCHGVPSPEILNLTEKMLGEKIISIPSFRDKKSSWQHPFNTTFLVSGGKYIRWEEQDNFFIRMFLSDYALRPSCYDCKFTGFRRESDLTLADNWGDQAFPEEHRRGLSLVIVHSSRGETLLRESSLMRHPTTFAAATRKNMHIFHGKSLMRYHPARLFLDKLSFLPWQIRVRVLARKYRRQGWYTLLLLPMAVVTELFLRLQKFSNTRLHHKIFKRDRN